MRSCRWTRRNLAAAALPDCLGASNANQDAPVQSDDRSRGRRDDAPRRAERLLARRRPARSCAAKATATRAVPTPIVNDVIEFRVFYRFDDGGFALAAGNQTNYAPLGGTVRDATWINAAGGRFAGQTRGGYVVAVIVCVTVASRERGHGCRRRTPRPLVAREPPPKRRPARADGDCDRRAGAPHVPRDLHGPFAGDGRAVHRPVTREADMTSNRFRRRRAGAAAADDRRRPAGRAGDADGADRPGGRRR